MITMRHLPLLPSLLLFSCVLTAEEVVITVGGHDQVVTLPALDGAPKLREFGPAAVRLIGTRAPIDVLDSVLVQVTPGTDITVIAGRHQLVATPGGLPGLWKLSAPGDVRAAIAAAPLLRGEGGVAWVEQEIRRTARERVVPNDLTPAQWHLKNDGSVAGTIAGNDLNVEAAWTAGASGLGINITVVDTGVDVTHPDLINNLKISLGRDIIGDDADPSPGTGENHATAVSGVAAARGNNSLGVTGVAFQAGIIPIRLITSSGQTISQTVTALGWRAQVTDTDATSRTSVSNNSWGPSDDGIDHGALNDEPATSEVAAIRTGVVSGRGGKGVTYVFASGNGRKDDTTNSVGADSCDFDGYASNRLVMAIGATNGSGQVCSYSEGGLNLFATGVVGDTEGGIVTTDRQGALGYNTAATSAGDYTTSITNLRGTSFAAPQAAGVIGLILEANQNLTWRDVRHIIARTAVKVSPTDSSWRTLPAPTTGGTALHWSPDFGFGRLNASAAVAAVTGWTLIPAESTPLQATTTVGLAIPDASATGVGADLPITAASDFRIESVEFSVAPTHADQSQLTYTLISPAGTKSVAKGRKYDHTAARSRVFTSLAHWGEGANGTWRVEVADTVSGTTGTLASVGVTIYGYLESAAPGSGTTGGSGGSTGAGTGVGSTAGGTTTSSTTGSTTSSSSSDSGGGMCGLGSGSLALLAAGLAAFGLRRKPRA